MDAVTHCLAAVMVSRAGLDRTTRLATPMLVLSTLAVDLDWLSRAAGPAASLEYHRAATHSLPMGVALAAIVGVLFCWATRKHRTVSLRVGPVLAVSVTGAGIHLFLDVLTSRGAQLLWPFRAQVTAFDLFTETDPWVLMVLLLGLLLPGLFRLVSEEIGARPTRQGPQRGAAVALAVVSVYGIGRYALHDRAVELLGSRLYHQAAPRAAAAFPSAVSPLVWQGVVETQNTLETIDVRLGPGSFFDPDRSTTHYKPEPSALLEAAQNTTTARKFLRFARFPKASVEKLSEGYRVELRDLRFGGTGRPAGWVAQVELDAQMRVVKEEIAFVEETKR